MKLLSLPFSIDKRAWSKPLNWRLWAALAVVVPGSAVLWASTQLLWLPDLPNCWVISWADASTSTRLYCARELGNRRDPEDLRQAIRLAHSISMDDPQRHEGDRLIDQLSEITMQLAEKTYQDGDLKEAINIAEKIPRGIWTYRLSSRKIRHWKTTWAKAESIYQKAEAQIDQRQWYTVLSMGRELLMLDNRYWAETKYPELMRSLQFAKESVEWQVSTTDVEKHTSKGRDAMLNQHQQKQITDSQTNFQKAQSLAQSNNPQDLRASIAAAQNVLFGTPHYDEARALLDRLNEQVETLENRPFLDRANELARKGDADSLQAAIEEANKISWGTALYEQANEQVEEWRDRLYQAQVQARTEQLEALPVRAVESVSTTAPASVLSPGSHSVLNDRPNPDSDAESLPLPMTSPEPSSAPSPSFDPDEPIEVEVEILTPRGENSRP